MSQGIQLGTGAQGPQGIPGAAGPPGPGGTITGTNVSGVTLLRGTAVAISGYDIGSAQYGLVPASNLLELYQSVGVLDANLAAGDTVVINLGQYLVSGVLGQPVDTSSANVDDFVFLGVDGALLFTTPPTSGGPAYNQPLGVVAVKDATVGAIQVFRRAAGPDQAGIAAAALKATTVTATAPLAGSGTLGANLTLSIPAADSVTDGYMTAAQAAAVADAVPTARTLTTTLPLRIGGGASANLSANRTLSINAATNAAAGAATAAQITALEAATAALAAIKSGTVTIASGASAGTVAMGAATWNGKPVTVTLSASAGNGKIGAAVAVARAVIAANTLTVTLLDKNGAPEPNTSTGAQTWNYIADGR